MLPKNKTPHIFRTSEIIPIITLEWMVAFCTSKSGFLILNIHKNKLSTFKEFCILSVLAIKTKSFVNENQHIFM
jgi:hypothetical protein